MSELVSRNIDGPNGRTSIKLEPELWDGLAEMCQREGWTVHQAVAVAQAAYRDRPRTSAVRSYLFTYFRLAATEDGHVAAGHGGG